jgi:hypothetical protein
MKDKQQLFNAIYLEWRKCLNDKIPVMQRQAAMNAHRHRTLASMG